MVLSGRAGAGKTTLAYCCAGVIPHFVSGTYQGRVLLEGRDVSQVPLPRLAGQIGFVQQNPQNQLLQLTVAEDVAFGPENLGLGKEMIRHRVREALAAVGLEGFGERHPGTLSGGEAQRAVLAAVLSMDPQLLILDQPARELDPRGRAEIYERLAVLARQKQKTIIIIEDRLDELLEFATRFVLMDKGRIALDCTREEFVRQTGLESLGLRLPLKFGRGAVKLAPAGIPRLQNPGPDLLRIEQLSHQYPGGNWGIKDISLTLQRGQLTAVMGANGAGKTTLTKHLVKILQPTAGQIFWEGQSIAGWNNLQIAGKIGYMFQIPEWQIFAKSVYEQIEFSLVLKKVPREQRQTRVNFLLAEVGLSDLAGLHPYRLSRGQCQLMSLAGALANDPDLLIADEPCAELDYEHTLQAMHLFLRLCAAGKSVLMISHDGELAVRFAHRLVLLERGRLEFDGLVEELPSRPELLPRLGLTAANLARLLQVRQCFEV